MDFVETNISENYWDNFEIVTDDIEFLYAILLEKETPLTSRELATALIYERILEKKKI